MKASPFFNPKSLVPSSRHAACLARFSILHRPAAILILPLLLLTAGATAFAQPVITQQPQSCTNARGSTATFWAEASSATPIACQWQKLDITWTELPGCTASNLVLEAVQASHAGDYRVVIANSEGSVTSTVARLTVIGPPYIPPITPTNFAVVSLGATVQNWVFATGAPPLAYQWRHLDAPLSGQTRQLLILTNVSLADVGDYSVVVSNFGGMVTSHVVSLSIDPTFTKITTGAIVTDLARPRHGPAWGDYNNDGYPDLYVHESGPVRREVIYRNNQDGTFARIVESSLQGGFGDYSAIGVNWSDYDNDGFLDLFIPNSPAANLLFRNLGDGTFQRRASAPLTTESGSSWFSYWWDYDRDGDLDLLVINTWLSPQGQVNWLYRNNGNGAFTKITDSPVVTEAGWWMSASTVDYDEDGWPDACIARYDAGKPGLYLCRNRGNGTFERITNHLLATQTQRGVAITWADYDNDGHLDAFVVTAGDGPNILYHNEGAGTFRRMTAAEVGSVATDFSVGWSAGVWGDFDNDGYLDLFVDGGDYSPLAQTFYSAVNLLYHNNGNGSFTRVFTGSPVTEQSEFGTSAWVDYDRDGFLDMSVLDQGHSAAAASRLFRNNGNANQWLSVKCEGVASPRFGTGTKVRVKARVRGIPMWQLRVIDAGENGPSFVAHFGLGDATEVETLRIEWPSGLVQEFHGVPAGRYLTVTEPARLAMPQPGALHIQCWKGMTYQIEGSPDLQSWMPLATVTNTNLSGGIQWTDPDAPGQATRFYRAVKQ